MSLRPCDGPSCPRPVVVVVRDSSAPDGWAHLCLRHWASWSPPPEDAGKMTPYVRKRKKRKVRG